MKNYLADVMLGMKSYNDLLKDIKNKKNVIGINGVVEEALGHFLYAIQNHLKGPKFIMTYREERARLIFEDLKNLGLSDVYIYPDKENIFYNTLGESLEVSNKQIDALFSLINKDAVVISTVDATLKKVMNKDTFDRNTMLITGEDRITMTEIRDFLAESGYENVHSVEGKGQFSIRGGILDIFSTIEDEPCRIEFFGDEIDSMRKFDPLTQRSTENIFELLITPARSILISDEERKNIIANLKRELSSTKIKDDEILKKLNEKFGLLVEELEQNLKISNLDLLVPFMDEENLSSVVDYIPKNCPIFIDEPRRIEERVREKKEEFKSYFSDLLLSGEVLSANEKVFYEYSDVVEKISPNTKITFFNILRDNSYFKPESIFNFRMKTAVTFNGRMDIFKEEIENYLYRGYKIVILTENDERKLRLNKNLKDLGINSVITDDLDKELKSGQIYLCSKSVRNGFEYSNIKFSIINFREIYGNTVKKKRKSRKKSKGITDFSELNIKDYVVHENHGVGIYLGTKQVEIQGVRKDYIIIQYAGKDRLYVPTDQLGLIHKYSSGNDLKPKINKLSSPEWAKTKLKVKKSVEDIAEDLIKLYAEREKNKGYQFSKDGEWQFQFEDLFPYQLTEGQKIATEEIKKDMESEKTMDRLLCADVGYGKTEVALRAAFKAVADGKQVAFLVPTTILAQQHYNTMVERFREFPINIAVLSRFKTEKEIQKDLKDIKNGMTEIVVGTHRLLSKDVEFKDLGLFIIDEEQRFGVKQKEKLKLIKKNVDCLTLTATPIPRTLQMSMIGIRDISVIDEPPEERFPVQTYVMEENLSMIKEAIKRELKRNGQIYVVYNRIEGIENIALEIKNLVPEANVAVAHGRISEKQLEDTMIDFLEGEINVLVSTTIIETGMDIPNVNTIIIYNSDNFGLSQLYQLRGRVGRSNRIAYAYLTYKKNKQLSEISEKRLMAIKEFTEFGSGFKIAARDLEIRGAGNILGAEQHGHIDLIGYDMYYSLLESEINKLKGKPEKTINDTTIELNVEAYIPNSYVEDESQRLELYKKISVIESEDDYKDLIDEIIDRYGDIPESVSNLMDISFIKQSANEKKILDINGDERKITIKFMEDSEIKISSLNNLLSIFGQKVSFNLKEKTIEYFPQKFLLEEIKNLIENI